MDSTQTIRTYEEILTLTKKMLTAARNDEWDQLILLEKECKQLTNKLKEHEPEPMLDHELQQRKLEIIHQVLEDDAQIRLITEPWLAKLQDMLNTNGHKRNLQQTYESSNVY